MWVRSLFAVCLLTSLFSFSPGVVAQTDRNAAVALFDDAQKLMAAKKYAEACPKFAESYRLDPQLGALLHLANCYEQNGQLVSAWSSFRDAAELAERRDDKRGKIASDRATALEPKLPKVTIVVPPEAKASGLEVRRDGVVIGEAMWGSAVPVDPGEHTLHATAPGKVEWKSTFTATPGNAETISIPALADDKSQPAPSGTVTTPTTAPPVQDAPTGNTQRVLGWTAVGAGAVGIGVGVVFMLQRGSKLDERDSICPDGAQCPNIVQQQERVDELTDEAEWAGTIGVVGLVAGSVLVGGGVALLLTAPSAPQQVAVAPAVSPSFGGLVVRSRF